MLVPKFFPLREIFWPTVKREITHPLGFAKFHTHGIAQFSFSHSLLSMRHAHCVSFDIVSTQTAMSSLLSGYENRCVDMFLPTNVMESIDG